MPEIAKIQNRQQSKSLEEVSKVYHRQILDRLKADPAEKMKVKQVLEGNEVGDNGEAWKLVIDTLISETAKDFTIMINLQGEIEALANGVGQADDLDLSLAASSDPCSFDLTVNGVRLRALVGVVDLEFKMYTKLDEYRQQLENHCVNYLKYL